MNNSKLARVAGLLVTGALLTPTTGRADALGYAYLNNAASTNAVIGFSHGAPDATFTVPSPTNVHSDRGHQVSKTDRRRQTLQP